MRVPRPKNPEVWWTEHAYDIDDVNTIQVDSKRLSKVYTDTHVTKMNCLETIPTTPVSVDPTWSDYNMDTWSETSVDAESIHSIHL